jgi:hypothetical protein
LTSTWRRFTSSIRKTPTHPNWSKKLPPAAAEVAQHEAAEVAQHEAAEVAEAAEAVQYEPAAAAVAEASQFGEAAAAAEAAVAGLAYNGRHWAGSGSANRIISAPKSDRAGSNRDPRYQRRVVVRRFRAVHSSRHRPAIPEIRPSGLILYLPVHRQEKGASS